MNNWKGRSYSEVIRDFIEFIETVKETYYRNKNIDEEMLKKQNDLLHDLELLNLSYHEIARTGKEIRQLRKNRREYKNEYLCIEPVKDFYKDFEPHKFIQKLKILADQLDTNFKRIENQKYTYRSNIDNIITMKKDDTSQENIESNDIIQLSKLVKSYLKNITTNINKDNEYPIVSISGSVDECFGIKRGKKLFNDVDKLINKFFKPGNKDISTRSKSSDILLTNKDNTKYMIGEIFIEYNDSILYKISLKINGKNRINKSNKNKRKSR